MCRYSTGTGGRNVYKQTAGENYLFYILGTGVWMVGPTIGEDRGGGILNRENGMCPDLLRQVIIFECSHTVY